MKTRINMVSMFVENMQIMLSSMITDPEKNLIEITSWNLP